MTQFWGVARNVFISVTFTCIFFENVAYVAQVEGVSMQPTLNDDPPLDDHLGKKQGIRGYLDRINGSDLVLLSHWSTRNYDIRRGDIVSLISPKNPKQLIIKRVIGLEGDRVTARASARYATIDIPRGQCWVEGDNSNKSMDSNVFGPVAKGLITAQAKCIIWPPRRWRMLPPEYPQDRRVFPSGCNLTSPTGLPQSSPSLQTASGHLAASSPSDIEVFQYQEPLNIEIRDHRSRIEDSALFMDATQID